MASRYPVQPPFAHGVNPKRQHPVQLQPQQQPPNEQAQKHREYLKQQQKLRLMASATHKSQPVSTDTLIENILGKKETFHQVNLNAQVPTMSSSNIPKMVTNMKAPQTQFHALKGVNVEWLSPTSPNFPPLYHQVWTLVGLPDGMVDTSKIYPLLLTSGLHTDVLGFIWGLSNLHVPGTLTEQELYVLLALVALAQRGYSFNCASVLNLVPQPPVPGLNLGGESRVQFGPEVNRNPQPSPAHSAVHADPLATHFGNVAPAEVQHSPLTSASQCLSTPFTNELCAVDKLPDVSVLSPVVSSKQSDFDDFTDFQSASLFTTSSSILPGQTAVPSFDASAVRESKDLLENTGIVLPKPSNSSIANRSSSSLPQDSKMIPAPKFPTVAIVGGGRSIGSRLANHSLTTPKSAKTRHHKHHHHHHHRSVPPTVPQLSNDEEFSDFQQASAEEGFSKNLSMPPPTHTYVLKESAIRINDSKDIPKIPEPTSTKLQLANEKQTTHITEEINSISGIKPTKEDDVLMGIDEDRYSALRALSAINDSPVDPEEEYGDFFSAGTTTNDSFANIAARDNPTIIENVVPWGAMEAAEPQNSVFEVEEWSSFVSLRDATRLPNISPVQEHPNVVSLSHSNERPNFQLTDEWGRESHTVDSLSVNIADLNFSKFSDVTPMQAGKTIFAATSGNETFEPKTFSPLSDSTNPVPSISTISSENKSDINDDFGDFVSPTPWSEKEPNVDGDLVGNIWLDESKETDNQSVGKLWLDETKGIDSSPWLDVGKYESVKSTKDGILDNPVVSSLWLEEGKGVDNQSVRSLELPGLDQAWDCVGEWRRCVQACVSVLQFAVDALDSISGPKVLLEVLTSSEGLDYLRALMEVWAVCERLALSYRQSGSDHKLDALLNSAESMWVTLKPHFVQAQLMMESDVPTEGGECCGICLVGGAKLEFGGHNYHAVCANLWLNLVDTGLPALHQP